MGGGTGFRRGGVNSPASSLTSWTDTAWVAQQSSSQQEQVISSSLGKPADPLAFTGPSVPWAARVESVCQRPERGRDLRVADAVEHRPAFLVRFQNSAPGEERQVSRHDREVHRRAFCDLADRTPPAAPRDAREQRRTRRIRKRLEERRVEPRVELTLARGRLPGRVRSKLVFLHHDASY